MAQHNEKEPGYVGLAGSTTRLSQDVHFTRSESPEPFIPSDLIDESPPWRCGYPFHHDIPKNGDPWEACLAQTQQYDKDMVKGWDDEVDTLLVFAGLFSAVVTAFTIESYQWLQISPEDQTVALLTQISTQLASMSSNTTILTSTSSSSSSIASSISNGSQVRINIYWFLSLTLSLASALLSILCKQWLREYVRETSELAKMSIGIRQMRYEGLWKWQVPNIIACLPLLLQWALILFAMGILELLWNIRPLVASVITVVVGILFVFVTATTLLPFFQWLFFFWKPSSRKELPSQCAYKSPQSWAVLRLGTWIAQLTTLVPAIRLRSSGQSARESFSDVKARLRNVYDEQWVGYDLDWVVHHDLAAKGNYVARGLAWIDKAFGNQHTAHQIWHCLHDLKSADASLLVQSSHKDMRELISPQVANLIPPLLDFAAKMEHREDNADSHELVFEAKAIQKELASMAYFSMYYLDAKSPYLPSCLEQCLRVINSAPDDFPVPASLLKCLSLHLNMMKDALSDELSSQLHMCTVSLLHPRRNSDHAYIPTFLSSVLKKLDTKRAVSLIAPLTPWLRDLLEMESGHSIQDRGHRLQECMRATAEAFGNEWEILEQEWKVLGKWVKDCEEWFKEWVNDGGRQSLVIPNDWRPFSRKVRAASTRQTKI